MSLRMIKQNKLTLTISLIILVFFFVMLLIYRNEIYFTNEYHYINSVTSTTTPEKPVVITTKPATTTNTNTNTTQYQPNTAVQVGHDIGIAAGSKLIGLSDADLNKDLAGMVDLGIKWVRFDMEWGFIQYSSPDNYDWSRYDRIVDALNRYGLKALPILTYTPEWARAPGCGGGAHCPPQNPNTFAKFASDAVTRYKGKGVHYWEIWNEPNSYDFWATKADCSAYTDLLKATYPAMKKVDSSAFIITGGLAQLSTTDVNISAIDFLKCIYSSGGKNYFDAIGDHPYTFPAIPSDDMSNAWAKMSIGSQSFRSIMVANGDSQKKIWMTEYGAPTGGPDSHWFISEDRQSKMVIDAITTYKTYSWAGPIFWYTYTDSGYEPTSNENFFGFVRFDGTHKPAYQTLKDMLAGGL